MKKIVTSGILVLAAAMAVGAWWFATRRPRVAFAVPPPPAPAPAGVPKDRQVLLANRTLWVGERKRAFPASFAQTQKPTARGTLPYAVVCEAPVTGAVRERAEKLGVRVVRFLPSNALLVEADAAGLEKLEDDALFAAAFEITPVDKIQRALAERIAAGEETPEVTVLALSQADRNALRKDVEAAGGELLQGRLLGPCSLKARVSAGFVLELLGRGEVTWVEGCSRPKLLNDVAATPAAMNATPVWQGVGGVKGLTGEGQIVSTSDSGVDTGNPATMHADLRDNVVWMKTALDSNCGYDANGHGTHTAGSIVGTGAASDGQIKGIAHGAKLQAWFCWGGGRLRMPQTYDYLFRPAAHDGRVASIHSASWGGNDTPGAYDVDCENCDEWLWNHPDFLFVVAAGNDGGTATVNTPATAKNCLAVGAVENARTSAPGYQNGWPATNAACIAGFSSCGPCKDGRVKPDVVAPGSGIASTRAKSGTYEFGTYEPNDRYAYNCGTSMATPLVAGAAAVVRQWLEEAAGFGDPAKPPTAAAMKAVLMGGATDVSKEPGTNVDAPAPNSREGWGRVNLGEALAPTNRSVKVYDRVPFIDGGESAYLVTTTNAAPLDVQLAWIDYPGSASLKASASQLVNDLDLEVTAVVDGEERRWLGNGGADRDSLNPAECVRIANAPAATYRIAVRGSKVAYDHVEGGAAALYVRGAFDAAAVAGDVETLTVETDFLDGVAASNRTAASSLAWGEHAMPSNAALRLSCNAYAYETNFCGTRVARHVCTGWTGTGSVPAHGTTNFVDVAITNDSTIVWHWADEPTDYLFTCIAALRGAYERNYGGYVPHYPVWEESWVPANAKFTIAVPEEAPCGSRTDFSGWYLPPGAAAEVGNLRQVRDAEFRLGGVFYSRTDEDVGSWCCSANGQAWSAVEITMDEGCDLQFCYFMTNETTASGLPCWWHHWHFTFDESSAHAAPGNEATGDPDGDGFPNAAECADETDPWNGMSFRFTFDECSPTNFAWTGSTNCKFVIERATKVGDGADWSGVWTNAAARASVTNVLEVGDWARGGGYFRLRALPK